MNNIGETLVAGRTWIRAEQVVIDNPYQGAPRISYIEKKMTQLDNGSMFNESYYGGLNVPYTPGGDFPLINPSDGSTIPKAALAGMPAEDALQLLLVSHYAYQLAQRTALSLLAK